MLRAIRNELRPKLVTLTGALLLVAAAAWMALEFRAALAPADLQSMTWDAASHVLIGLDLFDHLRRFEPLLALVRMQAEHWWPPLFGILSLPAYAFGGRHLSSAGLVSLVSYWFVPLFAWLAVRRLTPAVPLLGGVLIAVFCLRSPQLLEMSAWPMLELAGTLFTAAALYCFLGGRGSRARNWAYGLAGATTLLKYHYGFFLLVTFGVATLAELDRTELRALGRALAVRLRQRAVWIPGLVVAAAVVSRLIAERRDASPAIPNVPTLLWIAYILTLIAMVVRRAKTHELWLALPLPLRRFIGYGLIWPMIWLLDLANAQAWYRQLRTRSDPPARWSEQIQEIARYLTDDYFLGLAALAAAVAGVVFCIAEGVRRRRVDIVAVALHALWPVALLSLSQFRVESRFLTTAMVALWISATIGWALLLDRRRKTLRIAVAAAVIGVLGADETLRTAEWKQELVSRLPYDYRSDEVSDRFVRATVAAFRGGEPVVIILPPEIEVVAPTVRLGLRLAMPEVRPDRVVVRGGGLRQLEQRLPSFAGGFIGIDIDPLALQDVLTANGMRVVTITRGPAIPGTDRSLLIGRVVRAGLGIPNRSQVASCGYGDDVIRTVSREPSGYSP